LKYDAYKNLTDMIDGMAASCSQATRVVNSGAGVQAPEGGTTAGVYSNSAHKYVVIAFWNPNAATMGIGIRSNSTVSANSPNAG
jgi:hypothetical protein